MKKLLLIPILSTAVFAINFCGEEINLGDKLNLKQKWKSENTHLERETNLEICKIYKEKAKIIRLAKTIKKDFLILPDESNIQYLKIRYDDNSIILEEETEDKSIMSSLLESTKEKILHIDSGYKNKDVYTRMYSECKVPGKLCTNTIEKGYLIK